MGIPFTPGGGFLFTVPLAFLFTMTLGFLFTISTRDLINGLLSSVGIAGERLTKAIAHTILDFKLSKLDSSAKDLDAIIIFKEDNEVWSWDTAPRRDIKSILLHEALHIVSRLGDNDITFIINAIKNKIRLNPVSINILADWVLQQKDEGKLIDDNIKKFILDVAKKSLCHRGKE